VSADVSGRAQSSDVFPPIGDKPQENGPAGHPWGRGCNFQEEEEVTGEARVRQQHTIAQSEALRNNRLTTVFSLRDLDEVV
jgi:hypothetical protein